MLAKGIHHNIRLQEDYNKYGEDNFLFDILLECSEAEARKEEQKYIDIFDCELDGYNAKADKGNYEKRLSYDDKRILNLLPVDNYSDVCDTYFFDVFELSNSLNLKPTYLLRKCGVDSAKKFPSYTATSHFIIGCDYIDDQLLFIISNKNCEGCGDYLYIDIKNKNVSDLNDIR